MSLRKARFVHYQVPHEFLRAAKSRGFTVFLEPHAADIGPKVPEAYVDVYVSICAKVDHFDRAVGRQKCLFQENEGYNFAKKPQTIPVVELPLFLAKLEAKVNGFSWDEDKKTARYYANQWAWIWKYFL